VVPIDRLCDLLWDEDQPEHARRTLHSHVARIRAVLVRAGAERAGVAIESHGAGYLMRIDPDRVDAHRFRALVHEAAKTTDLARREELLHEALAFWRGPALLDAAADHLRERLCADLEELRIHAVEESVAVRLKRGRHHEVVAELANLTIAHPTRERVAELHMTALHRAGRTAEALGVYQRVRTHLVEQLGIEPGVALARLHQTIVRGQPSEPEAAAISDERQTAPSGVRPRCLPRDVNDFTGRDSVMARLLEAIPQRLETKSAILAINGMPGVGKTTLAVRLAHRVADHYPDGQLAIDLHGHSKQEPANVADALDALLRQLGVVGDQIPDQLDDRIAMWRSQLAGRRILLLLDNAATSDQLGPLLPTSGGCLALITSRRRLVGLDGVRTFPLELLTTDEGVRLLLRVAGDRVAEDATQAEDVVRRCGHLALAIRLAGARLAHRPSWTVADLARHLNQSQLGLLEITAEGRTVLAAFALSYEYLSQHAQRMFRLLGLHPGPAIDLSAAASLSDLDLAQADNVLTELVDAHLLQEPAAGRYRLHDLLKDYAFRLAKTTESNEETRSALERLLEYYLHASVKASHAVEAFRSATDYALGPPPPHVPHEYTVETATRWYEAERQNLMATIRYAAENEWHSYAWRLTRACWRFLYRNGYNNDCIAACQLVLQSARRAGDPVAEGLAHNYLAAAHHHLGHLNQALDHIDQAISIRSRLDDQIIWSTSLENRGILLLHYGRYSEATESFRAAMHIRIDAKAPPTLIGDSYINMGNVSVLRGDYETAQNYYDQYLVIATESNADALLGAAYAHLGGLALRRRQYAYAVELLERAAELRQLRAATDPDALVEQVCDLGSAYRGNGQRREALLSHRQALELAEDSGVLYGECDVRIELGVTLHVTGEDEEALDHLRRALDIAERLQIAPQRARALDELATVLAATEPHQAQELRSRADEIYQELGLPRLPDR
jgi:DNA-binding SARP family transcriptional activator/tetratricopeptide (TPR) repeat protein